MKLAIVVASVVLGLGLGHVAPAIADSTSTSTQASGVTPLPKLDGHIADPKSQMSHDDVLRLDHWLEDFRVSTSYSIVAFVTDKLGSETIEDLAYRAFNAWKIGDKGKDNGVLIVIATGDRKVRIETGKGVGGALTDLQASDIIKNDMAPSLKQGRVAEAIQTGASHIEAALRNGGTPQPTTPTVQDPGWGFGSWFIFISIAVVFPLFILLMLFSKRFRAWVRRGTGGGGGGGFGGPFFFGGGGGGWGGGGGSSGSGPDTGSGYSGGGGSSGGGGASDSY